MTHKTKKYKKCKKHQYRLIKEFVINKHRILHSYCIYCLTEDVKLCDWSKKELKNLIRDTINDRR